MICAALLLWWLALAHAQSDNPCLRDTNDMCELSGGGSRVRFLKPVLTLAGEPLPFAFDVWRPADTTRDNRDNHVQLRTRFAEIDVRGAPNTRVANPLLTDLLPSSS